MKSVSELIIDSIKDNGGQATLHQIYFYMENHKNEGNIHGKDPKKTIRGVLSKLKKAGIVNKVISNPEPFYIFVQV